MRAPSSIVTWLGPTFLSAKVSGPEYPGAIWVVLRYRPMRCSVDRGLRMPTKFSGTLTVSMVLTK